jgi:hypothetical protein
MNPAGELSWQARAADPARLGRRPRCASGQLPAGRERAPLAGGASGQLHQINHLVQDGARMLRVVLEDEGGRQVGQDHSLVLLLAVTQAPRGVLEG